jgi:cytochrome P450
LVVPTSKFIARAKRDLIARLEEQKSDPADSVCRNDLLSSFLETQKKHPRVVSDPVLASYVTTGYLAGSDTTAIALRSILYHTLRNPVCLERVRAEMETAGITQFPVPFKVVQQLPYLEALIREGLRIHFVSTFGLERVVPPEIGAEGWTMPNGVVLPVGTQVAFTGWTLHFDEEIFGPDPHSFNPERWLQRDGEPEEKYQERLARMNRNDFTFSYGPRVCLGKNIALMEVYMAISSLLGLFDVS